MRKLFRNDSKRLKITRHAFRTFKIFACGASPGQSQVIDPPHPHPSPYIRESQVRFQSLLREKSEMTRNTRSERRRGMFLGSHFEVPCPFPAIKFEIIMKLDDAI